MNFSGLGGITLVVVAVLWIFVFIPSWFNASAERSAEHSQVRQVKSAVSAAKNPILKAPRTKVASLGEQVYRADLAVRSLTFVCWLFGLTAATLGFAVIRFGFLVPELIASVLFALVFFRGLVMAKAAQRKLLVGSIRARAGTSANALSANARANAETIGQVRLAQEAFRKAEAAAREWAIAKEAERRAREFTVAKIPAPSYATQVGSLEVPVLAEVVDLGQKAAEVQTTSIDTAAINEILRKRRASNS